MINRNNDLPPENPNPKRLLAQSETMETTIGERRREIIGRFQRDAHASIMEELSDAEEFRRIQGYEPLRSIEDQIRQTETEMDDLLSCLRSCGSFERDVRRKIDEAGSRLDTLSKQRIRILQSPLSDIAA